MKVSFFWRSGNTAGDSAGDTAGDSARNTAGDKGIKIYYLWEFHVPGYKTQFILTKNEAFQKVLWYILKLKDNELTKFRPIFTE